MPRGDGVDLLDDDLLEEFLDLGVGLLMLGPGRQVAVIEAMQQVIDRLPAELTPNSSSGCGGSPRQQKVQTPSSGWAQPRGGLGTAAHPPRPGGAGVRCGAAPGGPPGPPGCSGRPRPGNEREVLTHPERLILTHLVLQDSRSGQGRQFRFTPPFGSSWTSSTRESGSSRRSSRRSGNDASGGPKAPRSSARPGRSGSTR